jgi:hypothetical protein
VQIYDPDVPQGGAARVPLVTGYVLCGGRSTRMGRDKAFVQIEGRPLALRVADALPSIASCSSGGRAGTRRLGFRRA